MISLLYMVAGLRGFIPCCCMFNKYGTSGIKLFFCRASSTDATVSPATKKKRMSLVVFKFKVSITWMVLQRFSLKKMIIHNDFFISYTIKIYAFLIAKTVNLDCLSILLNDKRIIRPWRETRNEFLSRVSIWDIWEIHHRTFCMQSVKSCRTNDVNYPRDLFR